MTSIKLSANLGFLFKDRPFLDRFKAARNAGFVAVECAQDIYNESLEDVLAAVRETGVQVVLINSPGGKPGDKGFAAIPGREEDFKGTISTAITYANALSCPSVHVLAGILDKPMDSTDSTWQAAKQTFISNLQYAAAECKKHSLTVTIEPITTVPNYFLQFQKQAVGLIKEISCKNVMLQFDIYHAQSVEGNLCNFLSQNITLVGHIQVSQVPGRHEPDDKGEINFTFFFDTLSSLGYKGWVGCEYTPRGSTEEGLEWASIFLKKEIGQ